MVQLFTSLSDPTRLKIVMSLLDTPRAVNDIYQQVGESTMTLSAISHQLKQMHDVGIVEFVKKGREKEFRLSDKFCWCILRGAMKHFDHKGACPACVKTKRI